MPFQKIKSEKVSQAVVRQIEQLILRGVLRPGERLPGERELAEKMGVSRPSLRDAIAKLQERGLVTSRAGAGIFVTDFLSSAFSASLVDLFASNQEAVFDYIDFRRDIEALAAERAARRGSETDLAIVDAIFRKMAEAHAKRNPAEEAGLDAEFHMAIVEASHNVIMLHTLRAMFDLLKEGVFYNRTMVFQQNTARSVLLDHHRAINAALQDRNPRAARAAVETHLNYIEQTLRDMRQAEANEAIARLRYERRSTG